MTPFETLRESLVEKFKNEITVQELGEDQIKVFYRRNGRTALYSQTFDWSSKGNGGLAAYKKVCAWIEEMKSEMAL